MLIGMAIGACIVSLIQPAVNPYQPETPVQGRAFAWQELHLVLASVIQRFDLQLADPASYS
jgi:hypothetical protein